jgi:DNA-binding MarR family transcriptional regulator
MKVEKVLSRLGQAPEAVEELRAAGQALGDELPRRRLDVLRAFRAGLARLPAPVPSFAQGYLLALADVAAAYDAAVEEAHTEAEIAAALSSLAAEILVGLNRHPALPKELASALHKDRAAVSRTLTKLHRAHLVQDYAIAGGGDGRVRPQRLTLLGQRVARYLADRASVAPANRRAGSEAPRSELVPAALAAD